MRFKLNWRFVLKLSGVVFVTLVAVHFIHRWQVQRQVGAFLRQADVAHDASDTAREITYLKRYLVARPTDNDARERLGRVACKSAMSGNDLQEAYLIVQDVLRRDPTRDELRRFAIDFAMEPRLGLFSGALVDVEVLLQKRPSDGELEGLKARCLVALQKYGDAAKWYKDAVTHRPDLVELYPRLAAVLRLELKLVEDADKVVVQMVEANRKSFRAYLLMADYWRTFWGLSQKAAVAAKSVADFQKLPPEEKVSGAIAQAVREAQKLAPDELDVILALADVARFRSYDFARDGKPEEAKSALAEAHGILKTGVAKYPKSPRTYLALAALEAEQRQEKEPAAVIQEGLEAIPDAPGLTLALLDYQIRAGDGPGATQSLDWLKRNGLPPSQVEFQEGRILMLRGQWVEASLILDHVQQNAPDNPALVREANLFLGRCYEQLGVLDRRLDAFRRAVPVDTTDALWIPAMVGVAEAEAALGKADASLQAYVKLKDRAAGAWVSIARLQMIKALQTPAGTKPDWAATEEAIGMAEKVQPKAIDVRVLRASLISFQGNPAEARKRLEALKVEHPNDIAAWAALAAQDQRDENPKLALATLAAAEKAVGDSPTLRLARAHLWVETKEPELDRKLESLAANLDKFTPTQQRSLLRGLAELASAVTAGPLGSQLWDRVAALQPMDLGVQLIRFDLALRGGDEGKIATVLNEVRHIDGERGASARLGRAIYLIWRAQNKKEMAGLDEAAILLGGLERERAGWARVAFAQALVFDLSGDLHSALDRYQKAVEFGESSPDALRRLMDLLRTSGRFEEAAVILQKLPKASIADSEVQRIAAEVSLRTNNATQAVAYADSAVTDKSTDPAEFAWQGQIYLAAGARTKAEASFRKAIDLRPEAPDGWLLLIAFMNETNRRPEGEKLIETGKEKISTTERALFAGMGYALVGNVEKAGEAFKQARAERPDDLRTLQAYARFLLDVGKLPEARDAFQRVISLKTASNDEKDFARQMIVTCLAADRDYATSRRALEELGLMEGDRLRPLTGNETPAQRRARVIALALQRDRAGRMEAINMLESEREPTPNEQFLLAQLYQAVGNRPQVRVVMSGLLRKYDRVALYVRFYAAWLIRTGDYRAAEDWVKRLTELQPDSPGTAELRARLAAAKGDLAGARKILLPQAELPDAPILAIAQTCESIKLYDDAEQLYKRIVAKVQEKQPQAPLLLAAFFGRRGRTAEALQICDELRNKVPVPAVGGVAVEVLYADLAPKGADARRVAEWLDEAAKKAEGDTRANLVQLLASVRNLQGDYAAAMGLYRDAIRANSRDFLAMNNLAFLISTSEGKHDEALRLLAQAKQIGGPLPTLLDTEALVQLNRGDSETARRLLETVTAEAPSGTAFFHLARAELAANRVAEARVAWQQAEELGIKPANLHPLERPELVRLAASMK
jgi:cellulose synthase operon protein C